MTWDQKGIPRKYTTTHFVAKHATDKHGSANSTCGVLSCRSVFLWLNCHTRAQRPLPQAEPEDKGSSTHSGNASGQTEDVLHRRATPVT